MDLFNGKGDVHLIERSIIKGVLKDGPGPSIVTEDLFHEHIGKDEIGLSLLQKSHPKARPPAEENLAEGDPAAEHLTLMCVSTRKFDDYDGSLLPLPMSEILFRQLSQRLHVSDMFLPILQRRTPLQTRANPGIYSDEDNVEHFISFVLHSNINTKFCYAASFSYDIKSRRMFAFVHSLDSRIAHEFIAVVQHLPPQEPITFWMIPSLLVEFTLSMYQWRQDQYHDAIFQLEAATGVRWDSEELTDPETVNVTKLTRDVNFTITNLNFSSYSFDTLRPMLRFVDNAVRLYHKETLALEPSSTRASRVERAVLEKNAYLCAWIDGMEKKNDYLLRRGQAQVQTIYSLIAQRDNVLSRKLTEASINQTEASQNLAKTSTDLAMMTSRDSTVMRTIAAVTIFFLPATFTATFFSTTFFDFHGDQNSNVVSWWLWLYFVITVALTAAVLGGWYYYAKRKEAELLKAFATSESKDH